MDNSNIGGGRIMRLLHQLVLVYTQVIFEGGGESQLIPAFIAVSADVVVGSVSLLVNLLDCTGPRGKD